MTDISSQARAAGRRFGSGAAQTAMAMAGGGVYYGAHALLTPSLYGTEPANIPKRCWIVPVAGVIGGHLLTKAPKVGSMGLGLAGGATAIGIEQVQMAVSIKRNQAASGQTSQTSGMDAGALLEPGEGRRLPEASGFEEAGALYNPPNMRARRVSEAAGLSL